MSKRQVWMVERFNKWHAVPRWVPTFSLSDTRAEARIIAHLHGRKSPFSEFRVTKYVPETK